MYTIKAVNPVKQDIKKLHPKVANLIQEHYLSIIKEDPYEAGNLSGKFSSLKSYHFKYIGVDYRIIYQIFENEKIVRLLMIGARENFYKKLKLRLQ
ncbi:MAG: type II toxin-antitoxin system mRNA interferase toxin, RelE/StbE family [Spirochaetes bacterium]|nr:type II toxin-antitoxin system mRNA interferase toxin, RelE/StbE family [Spirochaetota bacterium]